MITTFYGESYVDYNALPANIITSFVDTDIINLS